MAVSAGRKGIVTVVGEATGGGLTVAEMGEWTITGMSLPMIEYSAFADTVTRFKPGIMDPGGFSFSGYYDGSAFTATTANTIFMLTQCLNNGYPISNSTIRATMPLKKLRLWANNDTDYESYGFWGTTGSAGTVYITGMEVGTAKDGVGTVSFTGKVAVGALEWSTTT
jgi:hypothetical protein